MTLDREQLEQKKKRAIQGKQGVDTNESFAEEGPPTEKHKPLQMERINVA